MNRTGLTKENYQNKITHYAHLEFNHAMRIGKFVPKQVCRKNAEKKVKELYFIVEKKHHEGLREYDYELERAVENGQSTIEVNGRTIKIM